MEKECVEKKLMWKWRKDPEINQEKSRLDMATDQLFETRDLDSMEGADRALVIVDL